jgi:hypothetical protein
MAKLTDSKERCQSMEVVVVAFEFEQMSEHVSLSPVRPKKFGQLFDIVDSRNSDRINVVIQPLDADWCKLFSEKCFSKLFSNPGVLFDDRKFDSPLLIFT